MELFSDLIDPNRNLLPVDGIVNYYGKILPYEKAHQYLDCLLHTIQWQHDEAVIFGKKITTKRKVAWYGNEHYQYTYSNTTKQALIWTKELSELKAIIEEKTGETFNSCLLNLYHSGEEGMAWHSDAEKDLKRHGAIASLSFGAERRFSFKHKQTKSKVSILLGHGSLLVMKGKTQSHWLHSLPKSKTISQPRINLTFRTIVR
ncbi:alpha-ketoglutarate-dependent dioxygenase AlkB [Fulvivirgaceae bacterium BMA10]|uniref:Alpha-ketoglutarate-dependent dioxygenase AlkB n=1 Tax=Splendidivirga corallicola TaxID=3051826 RepID=A0ABT8KR51_9BACT|nr:alpha-ketoglutarate-dependent dioxygenase AlkB [Fulvivirgaceae bacterium BMA10]